MPSPGLLIDLYELTMAQAYLATGMSEADAVFSLFVRELPPNRGYLVACGVSEALETLSSFRFQERDLEGLARLGQFSDEFLDYLGRLSFSGSVRAVPEGTVVFANEPLLEVQAPLVQAQLVESALLNCITFRTALATKASRLRQAAGQVLVFDFGLRHAWGREAALALAKAAKVAGLDGTSNVEGALSWGLPASGTMAHSFVQAHSSEAEAFRNWLQAYGESSVLLIDTYDVEQGARRAISSLQDFREAVPSLRGVRIDSGDLATLAKEVRSILDEAGLTRTKIFVSGGLDEYRIRDLLASGAPVDGFGVGTALATSSDAPELDTVYKLVQIGGRPVRKTSEGKRTLPGAKQVFRARDFSHDVLALREEPSPGPEYEPLLVDALVAGQPVSGDLWAVDSASARCQQDLDRLPEEVLRLVDPMPFPVKLSQRLSELDLACSPAGP
jgi:nicotinate phosphoribosyltransferase